MRLVRGDKLPEDVKREVLYSYVYRQTVENGYQPGVKTSRNPGPATVPAQTDAEWLASRAFWVTDAGRLARNRHRCEPLCMVREG